MHRKRQNRCVDSSARKKEKNDGVMEKSKVWQNNRKKAHLIIGSKFDGGRSKSLKEPKRAR